MDSSKPSVKILKKPIEEMVPMKPASRFNFSKPVVKDIKEVEKKVEEKLPEVKKSRFTFFSKKETVKVKSPESESPKKVISTQKNEISPMKKSTKTVETISSIRSSKFYVLPSKTKNNKASNVKNNKNIPRVDSSDNSIDANVKQTNSKKLNDNSNKNSHNTDSNKNSERDD